ncbi:MAG: Crp/Fnr family transcriptional regulator [Sphingobacteriales bacterium]|nr:MAG: Crp/Fnr family transcriptional regulator [Sphingobacteriales bacterium]
MNIDQILDSIHPLPAPAKALLLQHVTEVSYPKGHILLRANKVERNMYFVSRGIVRAYAEQGEQEITFWFGKEGDPVISMKSYVAGEQGYENIELLEDCALYELDTRALQQLFADHTDIANWGRRFAEQELIKTEERLISRQFRTATERYKELLRDHAALIQRVPLGHIASYLGITQVSLSRIRADIR